MFQVRQNYIRRRLQITFKALQRLSQCEFSLEQLLSGELPAGCISSPATPAHNVSAAPAQSVSAAPAQSASVAAASAAPAAATPRAVTVRQVDRERGQPLTRFHWLQTLEEDASQLKVS